MTVSAYANYFSVNFSKLFDSIAESDYFSRTDKGTEIFVINNYFNNLKN